MTERTVGADRGQLVLISAVTIAFILLGVVVVFNGVLYTQTLSSSASGQSTADAERTLLEVTDGVCAIGQNTDATGTEDFESFESRYPDAASGSTNSVTDVTVESVEDKKITTSISYDSTNLEYNTVLEIDLEEDCN